MATGANYPDALAAGAAVGATGGILHLAAADSINTDRGTSDLLGLLIEHCPSTASVSSVARQPSAPASPPPSTQQGLTAPARSENLNQNQSPNHSLGVTPATRRCAFLPHHRT